MCGVVTGTASHSLPAYSPVILTVVLGSRSYNLLFTHLKLLRFIKLRELSNVTQILVQGYMVECL